MTFLLLVLLSAVSGLAVAGIARRWSAAGAGPPSAPEAAREAGEAVRRRHGPVAARLDPRVATGLALTLAGVVIVIGGAVVGALAYLVRRNGELVRIDRSVARWGFDHMSDVSGWCLRAVSHLGEPRVVIALAVVLAVEETIRTRSRWVVPFLALVVAGNGLLTTAVKELADRVRPEFDPIAATLGPSFPSGHSSWSAAFFAAAALVLGRHRARGTRAGLAGAAAGMAAAIAASRVLLDAHWLSDVLAGLALGWAWFAVCSIAFGGRFLQFGVAAEKAVQQADVEARTRPVERTA